jgi:hypothetical protein
MMKEPFAHLIFMEMNTLHKNTNIFIFRSELHPWYPSANSHLLVALLKTKI